MRARLPFYVCVALLAGAGLGAFWTRADVFFRLVYFLSIFIGVALVWALVSLYGVQVRRWRRGLRQQLGGIFEEQYELVNPMPLTRVWLQVVDGSKLPGKTTLRVISGLRKRSTRFFSSYTLLTERGETLLSPTLLYSGDPFGLFQAQRTLVAHERLLVLPYLVPLSKLPLPSGLLPGGPSLRRRTPETTPPRVSGVREYAPGDPLNRIHWGSTARRGRMISKEFEADPQADIWVFLDAQGGVYPRLNLGKKKEERLDDIPLWWLQRNVYKLPEDAFEYGVSLAGSLVKFFADSGQVIGFCSAAQKHLLLAPERGERQLNKILEALAFLKCEGDLPLAAMLEMQSRLLRKGSTVVLVTPTQDASVLVALTSLLRRQLYPLVILIDGASFGGPVRSEGLGADLQRWKIPTTVVRCGDELKGVLENGFSRYGAGK